MSRAGLLGWRMFVLFRLQDRRERRT